MSHLILKDIHKSYSGKVILRGFHLELEEGASIAIAGASAAGKSTLLKIACGLIKPDSGTVTLGGKPLTDFAEGAAIVFQNYSLLPWLSAMENVRLAVEAAFPQWSPQRHREQSAKYLEMVGLGKAFTKKPGELSGGMRQRVAIARAFAVEPRVLFLDEPFGALDALTRATLQQQLYGLRSATGYPLTTFMITNSVEEAILLSDRVYALGRSAEGAILSPGITVDLPYPRSSESTLNEERALRIRAQLAGFLSSASARGASTAQRRNLDSVGVNATVGAAL